MANSDPIRHVVLLMLENHSFDQMLGALKEVYPDLEGVDPRVPGINKDANGTVFRQAPTQTRQIFHDPHHEVVHVEEQLKDGNGGFVRDFEKEYPQASDDEKSYLLGYYPLGSLPALHALARDFTVCDRWHSSLPGPTWPNRFFALSGTSSGKFDMPDDEIHKSDLPGYIEQKQTTLFDRLDEKGVFWRCYFKGMPQSIVLCNQRRPENLARYFDMDRFFADAGGAEGDFPLFSFIEPDFMGEEENDDHPPHDVMKAQKLIADVYNAIRANSALWESTLLAVLYDEHGGFYDHVSPPPAIPPDQFADYPFQRYGVRVPALLVSPWVSRGLCSTLFDHTSLLRYLCDKWGLGPLGARTAQANSIAPLIAQGGQPRQDMVLNIGVAAEFLSVPAEFLDENGHQKALRLLMDVLEEEALDKDSSPLLRIYSRIKRVIVRVQILLGLTKRSDDLKARFQRFHELRKSQVKPAPAQKSAV